MTHAVETVAELLWNRFSPEHEVDWPSPNADEYRRVAADVLGAVLTRPAEQAVTEAMIDAAVRAVKYHLYNNGDGKASFIRECDIRAAIRAAINAAMEAGRHD